jgi:hypothetical protein
MMVGDLDILPDLSGLDDALDRCLADERRLPLPLPFDARWAEGLGALREILNEQPARRAFIFDPDPEVRHVILAGPTPRPIVHRIAEAYARLRGHEVPREILSPEQLTEALGNASVHSVLIWGCAADFPLTVLARLEWALEGWRRGATVATPAPIISYMVAEDEIQLLWLAAKTLLWMACDPRWPDLYYDVKNGPCLLRSFESETLAIAGQPERLHDPADLLMLYGHGRSFESALLRMPGRNVTLCTQPAPGSRLRCSTGRGDCFREAMLDGHERFYPRGLRARIVAMTTCSGFRLGESDVTTGSGVALRCLDGWASGVVASRYEDLLRETDWLLVLAAWKAGCSLGEILRLLNPDGFPHFSLIGDPTQRGLTGRRPGYASADTDRRGEVTLVGLNRSVVSIPRALCEGLLRIQSPSIAEVRTAAGAVGSARVLGEIGSAGAREVVWDFGNNIDPVGYAVTLRPPLLDRPIVPSILRQMLETIATLRGGDVALDSTGVVDNRLTSLVMRPVVVPDFRLRLLELSRRARLALQDPEGLLSINMIQSENSGNQGSLTLRTHSLLLLERLLGISQAPDWRDTPAALRCISRDVIRSYTKCHWPGPVRDGGVTYLDAQSQIDGVCSGCTQPTLRRKVVIAAGLTPRPVERIERYCPCCGQVEHAPPEAEIRFSMPGEFVAGREITLVGLGLPPREGIVWACVFPLEHAPARSYAPDDPDAPGRLGWHTSASPVTKLTLTRDRFLPGINYVRLYFCEVRTAALSVASRLVHVEQA